MRNIGLTQDDYDIIASLLSDAVQQKIYRVDECTKDRLYRARGQHVQEGTRLAELLFRIDPDNFAIQQWNVALEEAVKTDQAEKE